MRTYLFTDGDILAAEDDAMSESANTNDTPSADGSLGVGSLRES